MQYCYSEIMNLHTKIGVMQQQIMKFWAGLTEKKDHCWTQMATFVGNGQKNDVLL